LIVVTCPECNHQFATRKEKDIQCFECRVRFDKK